MNKVFIWLIVVLFVISIGAGAFAIVLNGKIGTLDSDTQAFKTDTAGQFSTVKSSITSVDSSLTGFKTDTAGKFTGVQSDITGVRNNVTSLNSDLSAFKSDTTSKLNSAQSGINSLNTNVASIATQLSESTLNARRVYDNVIGSVCQIIGTTGTGSGFVYSAQGYIVTCWHVVNGQGTIYVKFHDGMVARATVVGSDQLSDVAVIKVNGVSGLVPLGLGDSNELVVGEPVIVVGNPSDLFETLVYGVISKTNGRELVTNVGWVANLVQFDASSNPGNSGGPVFNSEGKVIAIVDCGGAYVGINFGVSSNKVKRVADAFISTGGFTNCYLPGAWWIDDLDPATAVARGLDSAFGFIFLNAQGVGQVQTNDICTAVDGIKVKERDDFWAYIFLYKSPGSTVTLTVVNAAGSQVQRTVTLSSYH